MHDRLMTVATFNDPVEAVIAQNYLQSEGITACLIDENTVSTDWALGNAIGGIKLQVASHSVEEALSLLRRRERDRPTDDDDPTPVAVSPAVAKELAEDESAEREDQAPVNQLADKMFRSAVFGLIFWPLQIYTIWLMFALMGAERSVSSDRRWKVWTAGLIVGAIAIPSFCFLGTCGGVPRF